MISRQVLDNLYGMWYGKGRIEEGEEVMYRPADWEYQIATHVDIDKSPEKTWEVAHSCGWGGGMKLELTPCWRH